jgi:hypothetical protein
MMMAAIIKNCEPKNFLEMTPGKFGLAGMFIKKARPQERVTPYFKDSDKKLVRSSLSVIEIFIPKI